MTNEKKDELVSNNPITVESINKAWHEIDASLRKMDKERTLLVKKYGYNYILSKQYFR